MASPAHPVRRPDQATPAGTVAGLALAMLLSSLGTSIANVALPTLATTFDSPFEAVQWVVLAYLLAVTTLIVSVGRLGDMLGRRRLLLWGIATFSLASIGAAASPDLWTLIVARAVQGAGAAVMLALSVAMVGDTVPRERAGRAMGFMGAMSAVGTALGPSLGGVLIGLSGWPALFLAHVPVGIAAFVLVHRSVPPDTRRAHTGDFDVLGSALLALSLAAYALSMTLELDRGPWIAPGLLVMAVVGAAAFVRVQSRRASPLVMLSMLGTRGVGTGFAMTAIASTVAMTTLVVGPFYLSRVLALEPTLVGLVMTAGPLTAALVGVPAGKAVDRHGTHVTIASGLAAMALGSTGLAVLPPSAGIAGYIGPLVLLTGGFAMFQAGNNTAVMTSVGATQRGVASGLLNLSRNLGLITGASAMGAVFALGVRGTDIAHAPPADVAVGMRWAFTLATALVACALVVAWATAPRRTATPTPHE